MKEELMYVEARWDIAYRHSAGETGTRFFKGLKEARLLARRCPQCQRVLMPPRSFCDRCHVPTADWVEVGKEGVIEAFTIVHMAFKGFPPPPYALACVRLEGADTALVNYVKGLDLSDARAAAKRLALGTRVRVRFQDSPQGKMTDFWYELA